MYESPEIGHQEFKASAWLSDDLEEHSFDVERGIADLPTAFSATLRSDTPGPTIALFAEYDALPDVGHGCGHNLIGAGTIGAALGLQTVFDDLPGRLQVFGTPAEELVSGGGKVTMLERGAFNEADVCVMFHPWTENAIVVGGNLAFTAFDFQFKGKPAHAAADPWNGINALDGVLLTYMNVNALRQHVKSDVRIHGIITDGGEAANIVPQRATAHFMVRAPDLEQLDDLIVKVKDCAKGAALATGTELAIERHATVKNLRRNSALQQVIVDNFALLGEDVTERGRQYGSTDFGNVSHEVPGCHFYVATHAPGINWHSAAVAEATLSDEAIAGMLLGSKVLAMTAIDLLTRPDVLETVQGEFAKD
jgi:amidohydrolase